MRRWSTLPLTLAIVVFSADAIRAADTAPLIDASMNPLQVPNLGDYPGHKNHVLHTRDAMLRANENALARLDGVAERLGSPPRTIEVVRTIYTQRAARLRAGNPDEPQSHEAGDAFRALRGELIEIERATLVGMRDRGEITEEILQRLQHDLDLEAMQPAR